MTYFVYLCMFVPCIWWTIVATLLFYTARPGGGGLPSSFFQSDLHPCSFKNGESQYGTQLFDYGQEKYTCHLTKLLIFTKWMTVEWLPSKFQSTLTFLVLMIPACHRMYSLYRHPLEISIGKDVSSSVYRTT